MASIPPKWWWRGQNAYQVEKQLHNDPEVAELLGEYKERFIEWAAERRLTHEPNLTVEVVKFRERYIKKRRRTTNLMLWKVIIRAVLKRDNYTCHYCGDRSGDFEIDHMIPVSRGGSDDLDNLVTSCRTCNRQKRDKTVEEFRVWREKHSG